ncbi:NAD+ kinase [Prevotella sp. kh1p2]|nr:NAD+ kinase [Prevotella sp. kh1p2]SNU11207.1 NAD+ kinase [Prevotellaceae bacterium KH2P17]
MKFALFGNEFQPKKSGSVQAVISCLQRHEAEIFIDRPYYEFLVRQRVVNFEPAGVFDDGHFQADFVLSLGGDGTFLRAASRVGSKLTPIVGVNAGRLGFLADVLPGEIEQAVDELYRGEYDVEEHAVIEIAAAGEPIPGSPFALNDIAVLKRDDASMISIRTCINGEYLVTYQADGLIISTPTGSTAYSLSNGGPIIVPDARNLCITPVAPHSLNIRPIVINDDSEISLEIESRSHNYLVAIDGRSEKLDEGTRLTIRKAPYAIRIVKRRCQRYFSTLREKMMWGVDQRQ